MVSERTGGREGGEGMGMKGRADMGYSYGFRSGAEGD
jgi:hypothetical protein